MMAEPPAKGVSASLPEALHFSFRTISGLICDFKLNRPLSLLLDDYRPRGNPIAVANVSYAQCALTHGEPSGHKSRDHIGRYFRYNYRKALEILLWAALRTARLQSTAAA